MVVRRRKGRGGGHRVARSSVGTDKRENAQTSRLRNVLTVDRSKVDHVARATWQTVNEKALVAWYHCIYSHVRVLGRVSGRMYAHGEDSDVLRYYLSSQDTISGVLGRKCLDTHDISDPT
jgi:hypothetical protein